MSKGEYNNVGSLVLDRPTRERGGGRGHGRGRDFKIWSALSGTYIRRIVLDTMLCGVGKQFLYEESQENENPKLKNGGRSLRSELRRESESEKLSELLRLPEEEDEFTVKRKMEALEELKNVVKRLQNDSVLEGAKEVRRLSKDDPEARTTLGLLGAIPPLVASLDAEDVSSQIAALYALLNLSIANDENKAAIVKAGAIHKMLKLIQPRNESLDPAVSEAIVANFLGLSALDSNKPVIGSSGVIPFLVKTLQELDETSSYQAKQDVLRALYNLSISSSNVLRILETDLIPFLMSKLGDMEVSERILAILSNIVSVPEGRKAISNVSDAFTILVDVLNWTDSPECQEKASYILMVMAHKGYEHRQAMIDAGIVSLLLELTLLGSTLAQNRASRILEFLRVDKGKQVSESYARGLAPTLSAPICGGPWSSSSAPSHQWKTCEDDENGMMSEERKAVEQLVQQSLENNMKRIAKRANLNHDFVHSDHFKSFTLSSTCKSLPF